MTTIYSPPSSNNQKTVFVTGGTGFVGTNLIKELSIQGFFVKVLVRSSSNIFNLSNLNNVTIVQGKLSEPHSIAQLLTDVDIVYHVAGCVRAKKYDTYHEVNALLTKSLLDACVLSKQSFQKIVVISSLAAVSPTSFDRPIDENHPFTPVSDYGRSKMAQELICHEYFDKLPIIIVRPPAVYGPGDKDVFLFFKTIQKGWFTKVGFLPKQLSLVHVKDLVNGIQLAAKSDIQSDTFFIAHPQLVTWEDLHIVSKNYLKVKTRTIIIPHFVVYFIAFFNEIINLFQKKPAIVNLDKVNEIKQRSWSCNPAKAEKILQYTASFDLKNGVEDTLEWYKKNNWL